MSFFLTQRSRKQTIAFSKPYATMSSEVAGLKQLVESLQKEVTRLSGSSRWHVHCAFP
jgi:hypothetical protein